MERMKDKETFERVTESKPDHLFGNRSFIGFIKNVDPRCHPRYVDSVFIWTNRNTHEDDEVGSSTNSHLFHHGSSTELFCG